MKSLTTSKFIFIIAVCLNSSSVCFAKKIQEYGQLYKKTSNDLLDIRKEFNGTQPKVYALLDQIDTMNRLVQEIDIKKTTYKKKYRDLSNQTEILKNKNGLLKNKVVALAQELEKTSITLEQEQQLNTSLKDQYDQLKQTSLHNKSTQSFNLTSTSEPNSPR